MVEDCPVKKAETPPQKNDAKTAANLQFEMIGGSPYQYSSDDVIFSVYAAKNNISKNELDKEKEKFFSKGQACLHSSPLPKRYGWGAHSDAEGKIAIYALETKEYKKLSKAKNLNHLKAMRSKRN